MGADEIIPIQRRVATELGLPFFSLQEPVIRRNMSHDGVHLNVLGRKQMAATAADTVIGCLTGSEGGN
eukprot:NODE_9762_length_307_cov_222.085271_g7994_i0.p3 GENE.NODE_9762_length_307_cov_222.085271_g7994_i0~~NODE_9762_length_307_cov_222.085271_g7994_i0.p3  ORF type:complete len:75 (+),score=39.74 NODE_9762_length_307_cov_222.085271_g7994_i0:23-226(+)